MNRAERRRQQKLAKKLAGSSPHQYSQATHEALSLAVQHHNAGRLSEAESLYQKVLKADPNQPDALHLLGVLAAQVGKKDIAADLITKAVNIQPENADAHSNLGNALKDLGKLYEAVDCYNKALAIRPDNAVAHANLGNTLKDLGKPEEALDSYRKALSIKPDYVEAHFNLGNALKDLGRPDEAIASYLKAIAIKSDYVEAYSNLGVALQDLGRLNEAMASFNKSIAIKPDFADAHFNLGNALRDLGKLDEAIASYRKALTVKPDFVVARVNLGNALKDLGQLDEAVTCYHEALAIKSDFAEAYSNLGNALKDLGRLDDAVPCYHKALAIKPEYAEAYFNLGNVHKDLGQLDEAVASYHKALAIKPDYVDAHSNLIFALLYQPSTTSSTILEEALRWDKQHGYHGGLAQHDNSPDPDRRLRIGYVSADFRRHAASYLLEPLLAGHNPNEVELFCYAEVPRPDHITKRFMEYSDHWRSTIGVSDEKLADLIRADRIDIIVDCTGHTCNNRLRALTLKPAPIQINHFAMHGTTSGVKAMDYVLSDSILTPPDAEDQFSEEIVLLPHSAFAFYPDPDWPEVEMSAPRSEGTIFACVGDPARINPTVIALWARLLDKVPGSRMLFKNGVFSDPKTREVWRDKFKELGDRLCFEGVEGGWGRNMDVYGRVDVVLDTLPMTGGTSCFIPLWMGVPVITMAGTHYGHRSGSAIVTHTGMAEFSAHDPEDYLRIASDLANDPERLTSLRRTLRDTIRSSHILDARGHAAEVEAAYRKIWRQWCERKIEKTQKHGPKET